MIQLQETVGPIMTFPTHNIMLQIPWGTPNRAVLSIPSGVELGPSKIPGAGRGILATTFLPRYTWLMEYEGEIMPDELDTYSWEVTRKRVRHKHNTQALT